MVPLDGQELGGYAFGEKSTEGIWYLNGSEAYDIDIQVQNYYDELRITEKTITYEVEASVWREDGTEITDSGVQVKKENTAVVNGVLTGGISSQDKITVEIPGHEAWAYEDGTEVSVRIRKHLLRSFYYMYRKIPWSMKSEIRKTVCMQNFFL